MDIYYQARASQIIVVREYAFDRNMAKLIHGKPSFTIRQNYSYLDFNILSHECFKDLIDQLGHQAKANQKTVW